MSVLGRKVGRADIRLIRGDTERVGCRWLRHNRHTGQVTPADISAWAGTLELRSPDGGEQWYSQACGTMTDDGYAICEIPSWALTASKWDGRRTGQWKITAEHPRTHERRTLCWGYWTLSD